jgi:hypothetical protein
MERSPGRQYAIGRRTQHGVPDHAGTTSFWSCSNSLDPLSPQLHHTPPRAR